MSEYSWAEIIQIVIWHVLTVGGVALFLCGDNPVARAIYFLALIWLLTPEGGK